MSDPQTAWPASVASRVMGNPLGKHLGMSLDSAEPDRLVARLTFAQHNTTLGDQVHGGAISALIDAAATAVAWTGVDPENPPSFGTTVTLEVRFMAPANGRDLLATATVPRRGGSLCFTHVDVHDTEGTLVAQGDSVYKLGYPRK